MHIHLHSRCMCIIIVPPPSRRIVTPEDQISPSGILCAATNLRIASRAAGRAYDRALAPLDLTTTQHSILSNIKRRGSLPSMELAGVLSLERTALYRAPAVLERRGMITHEPGRGREQILSLTAEGTALPARAKLLWQEVQDGFVAAFGTDW